MTAPETAHPFVGREAELTALRAELAAARAGRAAALGRALHPGARERLRPRPQAAFAAATARCHVTLDAARA